MMSSNSLGIGVLAVGGSLLLGYLLAEKRKREQNKKDRVFRVLIDMDGVLCNFDEALLKQYRKLHPEEPFIEEEDRAYLHATRDYKEKHGELAESRVLKIMESEGFFENLAPIEGSIAAVQALDAIPNVEIHFCTSPLTNYSYVLREKFTWIENHFGLDFIRRIIITKDKTIVRGDVLIDDNPEIEGSETNPEWEHVLFHRPYNKHITDRKHLKNWDKQEWIRVLGSIVDLDLD